ncbi:3-deoxy-7-phosphoheptulonate synthase [Streptomyces sp. NPDC085927]|uniref:3-deoxy-7-phosphoheptulonate synthase n=1 Tax=Streptomyces sp. NPDC085927 TaxID=3365738 RepID=UPI0037D2FA02
MTLLRTADSRITAVGELITPASLRAAVPISAAARGVVVRAREDIARVLRGEDDRLAVIVGPCSVDSPDATLAYARRLAGLAQRFGDTLLIVMRVYVEKPRTRLGWKGFVNDPHLDGTHDLNLGLRMSRELLREVLGTGLPIGCEFLDPLTPRYLSDAVSWASIGARTVQSQIHRQLSSSLSMPVGIKNATSGRVEDAVDAVIAAGHGHVFPGITDDGTAAALTSSGNPDCHVVLRGGSSGPNYGPLDVAAALDLLDSAGLPEHLVIDASHGNSGKDHERQPHVVADIGGRIATGEKGIAGVMLESYLVPGRQDLVPGRADLLTYGQSITDACAGWEATVSMVQQLAESVETRRAARPPALVV